MTTNTSSPAATKHPLQNLLNLDPVLSEIFHHFGAKTRLLPLNANGSILSIEELQNLTPAKTQTVSYYLGT